MTTDYTRVKEYRLGQAAKAARLAIDALARSDYVTDEDLTHAAEHLRDALLWVQRAADDVP